MINNYDEFIKLLYRINKDEKLVLKGMKIK